MVVQQACFDSQVAFDFKLFNSSPEIVVVNGIVELPARYDRRRPHVCTHILRVIERHDPAETMVAHVLIAHVIVLVPVLSAPSRPLVMTVAVGMNGVVRSQQTGQRAAHDGRLEDLPDLRDVRQDVISRIAVPGQHGVDLPTNPTVKTGR